MIISAILLALLAFLVYASACIKSQIYVRAMCHVPTTERCVFLTFDDGPDAEQTPQVLNVLRNNNATATFFCIGNKIEQNVELVKKMVAEGHTIGMHSYAHNWRFTIANANKVKADLQQCQDVIRKACGFECFLFRPPFGVTNPSMAKGLRMAGVKTVGWTIRTFDTNGKPDEKLLQRIDKQLVPGAIILLHDRLPNSACRLQQVIELIHSKGYTIGNMKQFVKCA